MRTLGMMLTEAMHKQYCELLGIRKEYGNELIALLYWPDGTVSGVEEVVNKYVKKEAWVDSRGDTFYIHFHKSDKASVEKACDELIKKHNK